MLILNRLLFVIMLIELIIVTEIEDLNYNKPRQAFTEKICSFTWLAYKCHSSLCKTNMVWRSTEEMFTGDKLLSKTFTYQSMLIAIGNPYCRYMS
uniref:Secreted protein n=1 Tax=Anguilla anguilla TaxID=7936 RepID=A0A0E9PPH2_ANGAN